MPAAFLISVRGLDDEPVELAIYEDHVECSRVGPWRFFRRKHSRRSMSYAQITHAVFRTGTQFGTVHLEDNQGTIINVNTIPLRMMRRAERLLLERLSHLTSDHSAGTRADLQA